MSKDDLVHSLGTIAQSGTANFLKALKVQIFFSLCHMYPSLMHEI
jgi:hypothetical protein